MKVDRDEVYAAIDGERNYQDVRWGPTPRTVGEFVTYIQRYTTKLIEAASDNDGDEAALEVVRKVAALAVACMEQHGAPPRKGY